MLSHDGLRSMQSIAMNAIGLVLTKNTMHQQYQLINNTVTWKKNCGGKGKQRKRKKRLTAADKASTKLSLRTYVLHKNTRTQTNTRTQRHTHNIEFKWNLNSHVMCGLWQIAKAFWKNSKHLKALYNDCQILLLNGNFYTNVRLVMRNRRKHRMSNAEDSRGDCYRY